MTNGKLYHKAMQPESSRHIGLRGLGDLSRQVMPGLSLGIQGSRSALFSIGMGRRPDTDLPGDIAGSAARKPKPTPSLPRNDALFQPVTVG